MHSAMRRGQCYHLLALLCLASLASCNEPDLPEEKTVVAVKPTDVSAWLAANDRTEPARWLRSREVGHDVLANDPEVDRLRRAMHQAASRFYEDERMIANRTAQTGDMLAATRRSERYVDILTGMIDIADLSTGRQLYGEMCQHYLIIRQGGKDREDALAQLGTTYRHCNALPCGTDAPK